MSTIPAARSPLRRNVERSYHHRRPIVVGDPSTLTSILNRGAQGRTSDYVSAAQNALEKDLEIKHSINTRVAAALSAPAQILPADDSPRAEEIAAAITDIWETIPSLTEALRSLLLAPYFGFALSQTITTGRPVDGLIRVRRIDTIQPEALNYATHDGQILDYPRLLTDENLSEGIDLSEYRRAGLLIYHDYRDSSGYAVRGGLARSLLWPALFKTFSTASWLSLIERFGHPTAVGTHGPAPSESDQRALEAAVAAMSTNTSITLPNESAIEIIEAAVSSGSDSVFTSFLEYFDAAITKAILGQTDTSTSSSGSLARAKVQNEVRGDKTSEDLKLLTETLYEQLIIPLVRWNFGAAAIHLAPQLSFDFQPPEQRAAQLENVNAALDRGVPIATDDYYEITGLPRPADGSDLINAQPPRSASTTDPFPQPNEATATEQWPLKF